jgi:lipoprotein-releasing system permease protein
MYKLFICQRYLYRRYLAWVAALAVALCVFMVLTAVSVFDGFLKKTEESARSLFGEVIIDATSLSGIGRYDEFIEYMTSRVPEVQAATPVIYSYGIIRIDSSYTETVQVCGIRLPQRQAVASFKGGMMVQEGLARPSFDPSLDLTLRKSLDNMDLVTRLAKQELAKPLAQRDQALLNRLDNAFFASQRSLGNVRQASQSQARIIQLQQEINAETAKPAGLYSDEKFNQLQDEILSLKKSSFRPAPDHMILGVGIVGLSFRTESGQLIRGGGQPGMNVVLTLLPIGRGSLSAADVTPNTRTFTVVDDALTDVYSIDSKSVYIPFERLQELTDMVERRDINDPARVDPARCSQIQIKVRPEFGSDRKLLAVRGKIDQAWLEFSREHPDAAQADIMVQTWRQKLDQYVSAVEKQRTMVTLMFGIMSLVSVILIFAIFYMIVTQKIRDIGVLRATGAGSAGVAEIFLVFGSVTGLVGSAVGLVLGYLTVHYINEIQDAIAVWLGFRLWSRDVFLFDKIPNQVEFSTAAVIAIWAMASGLIGALVPSVRAATMEPVEAIRYE